MIACRMAYDATLLVHPLLLPQVFPDLLHASPYVTDDPEEADYFYVWVSDP
jgi:hypothetical protein